MTLWKEEERDLRASFTRHAVEQLGDRLKEAIDLGAATIRVNRVKAEEFFRAHPRWARVACRRGDVPPGAPVLRIAQYLFWGLAMATAAFLKWPVGLAVIGPVLLYQLVFQTGFQYPGAPWAYGTVIRGIDEVGGFQTAYMAWLFGIGALLMGLVAYFQPNENDARAALLFGAWSLYSMFASLRYRLAAKAARQLALRSRRALDALVEGDVVEIRYETH